MSVLAPLACSALPPWPTPRPRAGLRAALALALGLLGLISASEAMFYARAVGPSGGDYTGLLGVSHQEVSFTTADGLELSGLYIPSRNGAAVIASPGRSGPQAQGRMLVRHGYGVLFFHRRGEGASEGDPNAFGWVGDRDLRAALAFLADRPDVDPERIGGIGLSVGGELLIETAAEAPELAAVVSEGAGGRSLGEELERSSSDRWILVPLQSLITASTAVFSNHTPPRSLRDLVGRIAPPPGLPHLPGDWPARGGGGSERGLQRGCGRAQEPLGVPESGHTEGIEARPQEYERRVMAFFDQALRGHPAT